MSAKEWIEIILAASIPVSISGLIVQRILNGQGIGVRTVQFAAVVTMIPIVALLSLERVLDGCSVAAIIGALTGYLFANIAEFDRKPDSKSN